MTPHSDRGDLAPEVALRYAEAYMLFRLGLGPEPVAVMTGEDDDG